MSLSIMFIYSVCLDRARFVNRGKNIIAKLESVSKPSGDIATAHNKGGSVETNARVISQISLLLATRLSILA